jgi:hypothetical protein
MSLKHLHDRRRREIRRQLPGIDVVISFFSGAGFRADLLHDGRLWVSGRTTEPLTKRAWSSEQAALDGFIDETTMKHLHRQFLALVARNARLGLGVRTFLQNQGNGLAIMHGDVRLALIRATGAETSRRVFINNFLKPGSHWDRLGIAIRQEHPKLLAAARRARKQGMAAAQAEFAARAAERTAARAAERAAARAAYWTAEAARAKAAAKTSMSAVVIFLPWSWNGKRSCEIYSGICPYLAVELCGFSSPYQRSGICA